jgi:ribosomal-protein-alanine N-acetyltransferase
VIANAKDLPPIIRDMRQSDLPAVAEIERNTYEYPWSSGIFRDCLLAGYTSVVLERDGDVVGYGIMSVAAGEAHLLNICVAKALRREGIGQYLLQNLMERAQSFAANRIFLEVRPSNKPALGLYDKFGFQILGVRERYYKARRGNEDAVVLVYHFGDGS